MAEESGECEEVNTRISELLNLHDAGIAQSSHTAELLKLFAERLKADDERLTSLENRHCDCCTCTYCTG